MSTENLRRLPTLSLAGQWGAEDLGRHLSCELRQGESGRGRGLVNDAANTASTRWSGRRQKTPQFTPLGGSS